METIHIRPKARHHGVFYSVLGMGLCCLLFILPVSFGFQLNLLYITLILISFVMGFIGILKLLEPRVSLTLCKDCFEFHHRCGGWILKWANIVRIDQPALQDGLEWFPLPYLGLKIRDYEPLLNILSQRLAVKLLSEQRTLLVQVLQQEYISGHIDANFELIEDPIYRSTSGHIYQGAVAMMGHRMARMRTMLGYDLLIPGNSLDREVMDFVSLMRRFQTEALSEQQELEFSAQQKDKDIF